MKAREELIQKYKYEPLPGMLKDIALISWSKSLPCWLSGKMEPVTDGYEIKGNDIPVYLKTLDIIANRYSRIVVGHYGAYLEIKPEDLTEKGKTLYKMNNIPEGPGDFKKDCLYISPDKVISFQERFRLLRTAYINSVKKCETIDELKETVDSFKKRFLDAFRDPSFNDRAKAVYVKMALKLNEIKNYEPEDIYEEIDK